MSRQQAIDQTLARFDDGRFQQTLARRVAFRTESQDAASAPILRSYLDDEIAPQLEALGFTCRVVDNPIPGKSPFLLAERIEPDAAFTLLTYGHGDVVRGYDAQWRDGLKPWEIVVEGNRWYGRGTADNKGQHTINLTALEQVLAVREGKLGYNVKIILEMGEEDGSPGLNEVCAANSELLAADLFLDAAENSDLIHDIGAFVLRRACQQVAGWPGDTGSLAVNISARQLADSALAEVIHRALAQSGLAPERLILEITETALMQDLATAFEMLAACRSSGIRVAIDDFGTGFAGFGYLRDLPVDEIKIDRSFVSGLGGEGFDVAIVGGIIHMAKGLGLRTTGEGVETNGQATILSDLGCDHAQGYLWSPAVPGGHGPPTWPGAQS